MMRTSTLLVLLAVLPCVVLSASTEIVAQFKADTSVSIKMSMGGMRALRGLSLSREIARTVPSSMNQALAVSKAVEAAAVHAEEQRLAIKEGMEVVTSMKGKYAYDYQNSRTRLDIESLSFDISMEGLSPMPMPTFKPRSASQRISQTVSLTGENFMIERYDIMKNFTKVSAENDGKCVCTDLKGKLDALYVPPGTAAATQEKITIDGKEVSASRYDFSLDAGIPDSTQKITMKIWASVEASVVVVHRVKLTTKFTTGGISQDMDVTQDFWNVEQMSSLTAESADKLFKPDGCECPKIEVPKVPATVADKTCTTTVPTGCKCFGTADLDGMTFCKEFVNYPVDPAIDAKFQDEFVKSAYDMTTGAGDCDGMKKFLCEFYFPKCSDNGALYKPDNAPTCDAMAKTAANAMYEPGVPTSISGSDSGSGSDGSSAGKVAVSVLSALVAAIIAVAF